MGLDKFLKQYLHFKFKLGRSLWTEDEISRPPTEWKGKEGERVSLVWFPWRERGCLGVLHLKVTLPGGVDRAKFGVGSATDFITAQTFISPN